MPELPERRAQFELRIAEVMTVGGRRLRKEVTAALGNPPDPRRVPEDQWARWEREVADELASQLLLVYLLAHDELAARFGVFVRRAVAQAAGADVIRAEATAWADSRGRAVADSRIGTIRDAIGRASARNGLMFSPQDARDAIRGKLTEHAANRIAITETTGGISAGEDSFVKVARRLVKTGEPLVRPIVVGLDGATMTGRTVPGSSDILEIWNTERDGHVCPICKPLHRKDREVWELVSPGGPPAHPQCRCWKVYRVVNPPTGWPDYEVA